ncbi:hypothetical protein [Altererythrobacter sp. Z27]|uniref:hypothetical protein n=1 Tax=Altererythrobacter sp. Z27 TaxID=3461147 RepID=UPI004043DA22
MNETTRIRKARPLGEIEGELLKAETDYMEADEALKKAKRARENALEKIISCQLELDAAVTQLRSVATPGSRWHAQQSEQEDVLNLDESAAVSIIDLQSGPDDDQTPRLRNVTNSTL